MKKLVNIITLFVLWLLLSTPAHAQQQSSNFSLSGDQINFGGSQGQSNALVLFGDTFQLEGLSQSTNLTQQVNALGAIDTAIPTPIPTSNPTLNPVSSSTSSNDNTSNTSSSTTTSPQTVASMVIPSPVTFLQNFFSSPLEEILPKQLFDIKLSLDNNKITLLRNLIARVNFTNFGTEATPVDLTFTVYNSEGKVVYTDNTSITVQTEMTYKKVFTDTSLPLGKYKLIVTTLYNKTVTDNFTQNFEIFSTHTVWQDQKLVFFVVIALSTLVFMMKKRGKK